MRGCRAAPQKGIWGCDLQQVQYASVVCLGSQKGQVYASVEGWASQYLKDIKILQSIQRRAVKVEKDLDGKTCKDQDQQAAELPWCAQPRAEELRGGVMAAAAPHREWRGSAELCSV